MAIATLERKAPIKDRGPPTVAQGTLVKPAYGSDAGASAGGVSGAGAGGVTGSAAGGSAGSGVAGSVMGAGVMVFCVSCCPSGVVVEVLPKKMKAPTTRTMAATISAMVALELSLSLRTLNSGFLS